MPTRPRPAILVAVTVAVICPACNEPQPDPDHGSLAWETEQLTPHTRTCACGASILVKPVHRVNT